MIQEATHKKTHILHKANVRGHNNHGWLDTWHSFSFASYFDPERINFGALRVWNDDIIQPGKGFGEHPHDNMEIITIPLSGAVLHKDTMGNEQKIKPNEVQVMSAGKGLFHAEFNASDTEELSLFQIWIFPKERNVTPVYDQREFNTKSAINKWQLLVGPNNSEGELTIHQDAYISRTFLSKGEVLNYELNPISYGSYLMVVSGSAVVNDVVLHERDAIGLINLESFTVKALEDAYIINIEVPEEEK